MGRGTLSAQPSQTQQPVSDPFMDAIEPYLQRFRDTQERRASLQLHKAIRLAPTLEVCEALLRGEKVPASKLDPYWLKAYGR